MISLTRKPTKIAKQLIVYSILFSSAITLIATAIQLYSEYSRDVRSIDARIEQIKQSYSQSISSALWVTDKQQLLAIIDGIHELPDIEYVIIRAEDKIYVSSGSPSAKNIVTATIPLYYRYRSKNILIGEMHIEASHTNIYKKLKIRFIEILVANGIKTFLVALFIYFIFNYLVTRHLLKIAKFALEHDINDSTHRVILNKKGNFSSKDEIDIVAEALNKMQENLSTSLTELKISEENLFKEKESIEITLQSIADAVMTTDPEGFVQYMNPAAEQLTGWRNSEAQGQQLGDVFHIINELTREVAENPVKQCLRDGTVVSLANHTVLIKRNGEEISIEDSAAPIRDRNEKITGVVMVFHDCSNERQLKHQLSHQASHDSLTGLANRREFEDCLEDALVSAKRHNVAHALIYLDLDQFKIINDTCGHVAGDELLRQLSIILKNEVREADVLARLGGDEFGVLLERTTLDHAELVAEKIRLAIRNFRYVWQDKIFEIGASIGLTDITAENDDSASLLSTADVACYAAKEMGRNRIHIYTKDDTNLAERQTEMQWVARIKQALDEDRFCLYGQAIVPVENSNSKADHFEILVRMLDEEGKIVPPGAFIPAAERYNLMSEIDRWVISNAFANYNHLGFTRCQCQFSINLSGISLNNDFLDFIHAQFQKHNISPKVICFEITETTAVANLASAIQFINSLKSIGCRFSLDDFGSGISSFAYLKNLPVDYLKIDGNFVKDMVNDPIDRAMVESITKIGHVMELELIAEYVETKEIVEELRKIGVDFAQGYGIDKPKPLSELCEKV